uniref:Reverse transcriptase domain-containing protein n=1 Tax=Tanacetum cinerariifolium TaxID=118510 RepID=A0A699ING1_TANCI|nr:hypothetical protein [Tanacetum cinerariifolium]
MVVMLLWRGDDGSHGGNGPAVVEWCCRLLEADVSGGDVVWWIRWQGFGRHRRLRSRVAAAEMMMTTVGGGAGCSGVIVRMSDDRVFFHPCTYERCRRNYTDKFCPICCFESGNAFIDELIANSFDDLLNSSDHPPQHQTHSFESYKDNPNYGYPPQEPFVYNQASCYKQNFVDNSQIPPQPYLDGDDNDDDYDKESIISTNTYIFEIPSSNAITTSPPVLPTEDPNNSLSMGDKHLSTIPETESDEVIKSNVENLVPIPSESEGIFDDTCDVPFRDNSPPFDVLTDHFELFFEFNDDCTSSDDDYFEDINYVEASPPVSELVSLEEVQDNILREKLLNINLLITKIESLNDNSTPDCVLKSPSPFPIPVEDSDSFFEKFDTSLSYSNNSLPEFETFSDHTEETSSGSTTTHADNSLPEIAPDLKASHACGFVRRPLELQSLAYGNPIS